MALLDVNLRSNKIFKIQNQAIIFEGVRWAMYGIMRLSLFKANLGKCSCEVAIAMGGGGKEMEKTGCVNLLHGRGYQGLSVFFSFVSIFPHSVLPPAYRIMDEPSSLLN